jgi:hypothetical protein
MKRGRKTQTVYRMQVNEGGCWRSLTQRNTKQEALDDLADSELDDPDLEYRVTPRRIYPKRTAFD